MMMDCPRCGFAQPKDRFCANCGLDVDAYLSRPKPLLLRLLQNPTLHLSLIAILIVVVAGYILYARREMVSREVGEFLSARPRAAKAVSASPETDGEASESEAPAAAEPAMAANAAAVNSESDLAVAAPGSAPDDHAAAKTAVVDPKHVDLAFYEISREALGQLVTPSDRLGESNEGRWYSVKDVARLNESLKNARKLGLGRTVNLEKGAQTMVVTPPSTPEPFQFGLALQVRNYEAPQASLHWDSQLVLSQPESAAELASTTPALKAVVETTMNVNVSLSPQNAILILFEPGNRRPRDEYLVKAGDGPWSVFSSEDFRAGVSDWIAVLQLK